MTSVRRCRDSGTYVPTEYRRADGSAWCGGCGKRVRRTPEIDFSSLYGEHDIRGRELCTLLVTEAETMARKARAWDEAIGAGVIDRESAEELLAEG